MWRSAMRWHKKELTNYMLEHEMHLSPIAGNYFNKISRNIVPTLRSGRYYIFWQNSKAIGIAFAGNDGNAMMHLSKFVEGADFNLMYGKPHHALWDYSGGDEKIPYPQKILSLRFRPLLLMVQTQPISLDYDGCNFIHADNKNNKDNELFIGSILEQCFGFRPSAAIIKARLRERAEFEPHILLEKDGKKLAQAHVQSASPNYSVVGGVATLLGHRGKGYASIVTSYLCDVIRKDGRVPILTVDTNNQSAIAVYKKLGFEIMDNVHSYQRRV